MKRARAGLIALASAVSALTLGGCVERRLFITSDPPGAIVHLDDVEVGVTPVEVAFTWYGVYDVRLDKDGYEPLVTKARADAPWFETPGLDLIAEALPNKVTSHVHWSFTLKRAEADPDAIVERGRAMRAEVFPVEPIKPGEPIEKPK